MTRRKTQTLSQATIDVLNTYQPNREYLVSWDEKGELIKITLVGGARPLTQKQRAGATYGTKAEREDITESCIQSTKNGSMVMTFQRTTHGDIFMNNPLGEGYIMYDKNPVRILNSLDDAVNELLKHKEDETYDLVLRYKRRQNKWFLHAGIWAPDLPVGYKASRENPLKAYILQTRSHVWEPAQSAE